MSINLTLIAQALAFAALIWLIATFIWPPLLKAIEERQQKIAEGLAAADRSQKDLAQAQAGAQRGQADHDADGQNGRSLDGSEGGQCGFHGFLRNGLLEVEAKGEGVKR